MINLNSNKGVTLAILIVVIIVVIILLGISINMGVDSIDESTDEQFKSELYAVQQAIYQKQIEHYDKRFLPVVQSNDVIVGKIANDRMVIVMDWFFRGFISDVGLVKSLQALGLGDQYCAITHSACSRISIQNERSLSESECAELRAKSQMSRSVAVKMVDRIRLEHRRDGLSFMEIIERDTGEKWYDA